MRIYKNANIFEGAEYKLLSGMSLIEDQGKIVKITKEPYENAIDLRGGYVLPAFIDAHCHLGDTGAKEFGVGLTLEEAVVYPNGLKHRYLSKISEEELVETIRQGLLEMLRNGIAVIADYREGGLKGVLALRKAAEGLPIHALALGRPTGSGADGKEVFDAEIKALLEAADGIGMGGIYSLKEEDMRHVREAARDKLFSIHIAEGRMDCENSMREFGKSEVERAAELETDFMVHLTHTDGRDRRILKENKIPIVCCPRTNLILGDGFPELDLFAEDGISFGLGSDNMMFTSPDMFREMDTASRVIRGIKEQPDHMPFEECLKASAYGGAKALKLEDKYGSLEEGKSASFFVISAESPNLKYSHDIRSSMVHRVCSSDIKNFVVDGMDVIKDGKFLLE